MRRCPTFVIPCVANWGLSALTWRRGYTLAFRQQGIRLEMCWAYSIGVDAFGNPFDFEDNGRAVVRHYGIRPAVFQSRFVWRLLIRVF